MNGDKQREEVWGNAGGDQQADLTLQEAEEGALEPRQALRNKMFFHLHSGMC